MSRCPVCDAVASRCYALPQTVLRCSFCGLFQLEQFFFDDEFSAPLDERERIQALRPLRERNYSVILDQLRALLPPTAHGLEVGSAYGWFQLLSERRGLHCTGIEPQPALAEAAIEAGADTTVGFFPADVPQREAKYDFVIFNDVLEHLPDIDGAVAASRDNLLPGGLLVVNLPLSSGVLYRLADLAYRTLRWSSPLARLYQLRFHSPHAYYFDSSNLALLAYKHGLVLKAFHSLPSIDENVIHRTAMDRSLDTPAQRVPMVAAALVIRVFRPLILRLRPDIGCFYFERPR